MGEGVDDDVDMTVGAWKRVSAMSRKADAELDALRADNARLREALEALVSQMSVDIYIGSEPRPEFLLPKTITVLDQAREALSSNVESMQRESSEEGALSYHWLLVGFKDKESLDGYTKAHPVILNRVKGPVAGFAATTDRALGYLQDYSTWERSKAQKPDARVTETSKGASAHDS